MRFMAFVLPLGALCLLSSGLGAADMDTIRCGQLSSVAVEEKNGNFTHAAKVYRRSNGTDQALFAFGSDQMPRAGCLRNAVLVLFVGDPVEAGVFVLIFPDGRRVSIMRKDADIAFEDGRAIVRSSIFLPGWERQNVPSDFVDLFRFPEPR